jgi:hypothetical protein
LPVTPRKRMSYVFDCRADLPPLPLTIDTTGVTFRPEGGQYIAIHSPPPEDDPVSGDLNEDYGPFEDVIWPALAARVPAFEAIKLTGAWAGHYDYNGFDQNGRRPGGGRADRPRRLPEPRPERLGLDALDRGQAPERTECRLDLSDLYQDIIYYISIDTLS